MKRCPACGTVYSVTQGFCPMDGAPLADALAPGVTPGVTAAGASASPSPSPGSGAAVVGDASAPGVTPGVTAAGASASPSPGSGAAVVGVGSGAGVSLAPAAWDPPRAPATTAEVFVVPPQSRAASTGGVSAVSNGSTVGGFVAPPQARGAASLAPAPTSAVDSAETGTAFIPPVAAPGAVRPALGPQGPARTVMAMVPPGTRAAGAGVLAALDAPRADLRPNLSSGPGAAAGLAQVPATAAVPTEAIEVDGAFFPAGGLARPRPDPALSPTSWEESLIGRVLDQRYRIESCIGAGGMGVVYKARHVIIDKPLAIKMLRAEVASQPDVVKRFLLEAQLASRVKHPNVVDISDYGQLAGQTAYYVMEYLAGETLANRIDTTGRIDPALAIEIAIQTAQALQAAHASKIIHRDLKSENIFLCTRPDGGVQAKILDFGIARIRDKKTRLTAMGALIGTPAYMSPEQAQGAEVDERSDLYALGIILFEMLAGRVPFKAPTVAMILSAQIFDAPPSMREIEAGVPDLPNLEHVIHRLLAKNREERPSDAAEVIHLLRTAAEVDLSSGAVQIAGTSLSGKRRPTVTIGSWSVAENPSGLTRVDTPTSAPVPSVELPRESDAAVPRTVTASGRIQRRPSVIVPSGTRVERIAAPPTRPPTTGEVDQRHYPTGVSQAVPRSGPPMILIIAAAASIGAAITVTLYKQVWRRTPVAAVQASELPVASSRLTFESDPPGAAVIAADGERWGLTPFSRELPVTSPPIRVVFKLAGHEDVPLDVAADESARHRVHLRRVSVAPAPPATDEAPGGVMPANPEIGEAAASAEPPVPNDTTAATRPAGATPAAIEDAPGRVTPGRPRPAKTRAEPPSKDDTPATPVPAPTPVDDELDMGELKNPFRNK